MKGEWRPRESHLDKIAILILLPAGTLHRETIGFRDCWYYVRPVFLSDVNIKRTDGYFTLRGRWPHWQQLVARRRPGGWIHKVGPFLRILRLSHITLSEFKLQFSICFIWCKGWIWEELISIDAIMIQLCFDSVLVLISTQLKKLDSWIQWFMIMKFWTRIYYRVCICIGVSCMIMIQRSQEEDWSKETWVCFSKTDSRCK
jgi:hypothetical protein